MSDDIHEVYAIAYGKTQRHRRDNYIFGDPHDEMTDIAYYVWAIKGPHGVFVVDTGFDAKTGAARGRTVTKPVDEGLRALDIAPDQVGNVILTHMHWDHAGNHEMFPGARYHVQDTEMEYATGRCMCHHLMRVPFGADDIVSLVRKVFADRVDFHDGTDEIAPGITVHKIGGHSKGLQCVRVKTQRGYVVLSSDGTHLYSHLDEGRVFPITYNVAETVEGYRTLKKLAGSRDHVIPGHDPLVLDIYPAAKPGMEGWISRLDVAPKMG